jgi:hypothetical protein
MCGLRENTILSLERRISAVERHISAVLVIGKVPFEFTHASLSGIFVWIDMDATCGN